MTMARPAPPRETPAGYEYVTKIDEWWRVNPGRRCRFGAGGGGHKACGEPSVAELNRGRGIRRDDWWAYCAAHLYGGWIEDGKVMIWILREVSCD